MAIDNLWGNLPEGDKIETPLSILKEQANYLTVATKGLLEGKILVLTKQPENIQVSFRLVAPPLGGYEIELFAIGYGIGMYPVNMALKGPAGVGIIISNTQEQFLANLGKVLQSPGVRDAVSKLMTQIKSSQ